MIRVILAITSLASLAAMLQVSYVLKELSMKLGSVTKMPRYYRAYYIMGGLIFVAVVGRMLKASLILASSEKVPPPLNEGCVFLLLYHLPLFLSAAVGLAVTLKYWAWLLKEE